MSLAVSSILKDNASNSAQAMQANPETKIAHKPYVRLTTEKQKHENELRAQQNPSNTVANPILVKPGAQQREAN